MPPDIIYVHYVTGTLGRWYAVVHKYHNDVNIIIISYQEECGEAKK